MTIEQGRGSATTAVLLSQEKGDIAHLNITNAAQVIGKGGALKVIAIYQHQSGASFVGIKGNVELDGPESLVGPRIGSTPGGSDALSLKICSKVARPTLKRQRFLGGELTSLAEMRRPSIPTSGRQVRSQKHCSSPTMGCR